MPPHDDLDLAPDSVVLLVGPAAAGKSTFAAEHFPPTARINLDTYRAMASDSASDQTSTPTAVRLQRILLKERARRGLQVVLDSTNLQPAIRRKLLRIARRSGRPVVVFLFQEPFEVCLAANSRRRRQVPPDVISHQHRQTPTAAQLHAEGFDDVRVVTRHLDYQPEPAEYYRSLRLGRWVLSFRDRAIRLDQEPAASCPRCAGQGLDLESIRICGCWHPGFNVPLWPRSHDGESRAFSTEPS